MAAAGAQGRKRILKEEDMTKVEFETSEEVDVTPTFDTMGLREDLLRGIYAYGRPGFGAASGGKLAQLVICKAKVCAVCLSRRIKDISLSSVRPRGHRIRRGAVSLTLRLLVLSRSSPISISLTC